MGSGGEKMNRSMLRNARRRSNRPIVMGAWCDKKRRMVCPFCGLGFDSFGELIEHQDDEGHVVEG